MAARTSHTSVTFEHAFTLSNLNEILPSGTYEVETDEERLEGLSFEAYRRTLTVIHLPSLTGNPDMTRALSIDPDDLEAAIQKDRATTASSVSNEGKSANLISNGPNAFVAIDHEAAALSPVNPDD